MAKNYAELIQGINQGIPDNNQGLVSPADVRQNMIDLADWANELPDIENVKGAYNASTNSPTLTATPDPTFNDGSYYDVTVSGAVSFAGSNFTSGTTLNIGDRLKKKGTQWYLIQNSSISQNRAFLAQKSSILLGDSDLYLADFVMDVKFTGLNVGISDIVHFDNVRRAKSYAGPPSFTRHLIRISINGSSVCEWFVDNFTEPTADSKGNIISKITLTQTNSSGISADVLVNWNALATNTEYVYNSSTDRLKARISPKIFNQKLGIEASTLFRDGVVLTTYQDNQEKNPLFIGGKIDSYLRDALLDVKFSGLTASDTDVIAVGIFWRNYNNSGTQTWSLSFAKNGTRFCSWTTQNYVEPTADSNGNKIVELSIPDFGGSGITAIATVNWAKVTVGAYNTYITGNLPFIQAQLNPFFYRSKNTYPDPVLKAYLNNQETNPIFYGDKVDSYLRKAILSISLNGLTVSDTDIVSMGLVWRNYNNSGTQTWSVSIAVNGTRVCTWTTQNYVEPTADSKGNIIAELAMTELSSSGVSGTILVNWAKIASGVNYIYTTGNLPREQALISPFYYKSSIQLPSTATPHNIYSIRNDIDTRTSGERGYSTVMYVDRFLKSFPLNTDVRFQETKLDKYFLVARKKNDNDNSANNLAGVESTSKSIVIDGGKNYKNKTITFAHKNVPESLGQDANIMVMPVGDSWVFGLDTERGTPSGLGNRFWGVMAEQNEKARIDYLLWKGYSVSDIQNNNISSADQLKFRWKSIGRINTTGAVETFNINYRGVTKSVTLRAEGRGGWSIVSYLNKPENITRGQGAWDALGLGNGTGTDWTGSDSQVYLFDRTAWNPSAIVDTPAMRAFFLSTFSFTGSTLADYITKAQQIETNPFNYFYDKDMVSTVTDANGNTWQIKFSLAKYLSRYRTLDNNGVRLTWGDANIGTSITQSDLAIYDVTVPSHFVVSDCQNFGNYPHFGVACKVFGDNIKNQYTTNSWGTPIIGFSIVDGTGTYFPNLYPEYGSWAFMDETMRTVHDNNLSRILTTLGSNESSSKLYVIPNTFIVPTAKGLTSRPTNDPIWEITQEDSDKCYTPNRTSVGIKGHANNVGHRAIGLHTYAWLKSTFG